MASLYIKDQEANALAERLARMRGLTKTAAVKLALQRELDRDQQPTKRKSVKEIIALLDQRPLPPPNGLKADKAFFDRLWGEEEWDARG